MRALEEQRQRPWDLAESLFSTLDVTFLFQNGEMHPNLLRVRANTSGFPRVHDLHLLTNEGEVCVYQTDNGEYD